MRAMVLLALLGHSLAGCAPDRAVATVVPEQAKIETKEVPGVPNKDVDILFVVDDSGSMKEEQDSLRANFARFIGVLDSIPGGRPNVQIGVITPNLGTTAIDGSSAASIGTCTSTGGERGELRTLGSGGPRFLRDVAVPGGRSTNFPGTLADAFSQLATVGITGCGIEQHLEAMKRALDGNPVNTGFIRENAYLAVIVIADEDDCSLARASLFDGDRGAAGWSDTVNFRCTSEGVACDGPGTPLDQATGPRTGCHPRDDSQVVATVDRYADFLKSKKRDPRDVIVAGILGDPEPFSITTKPGTSTKIVDRSCTYAGPTGEQFAFPAVRTADFLAQFQNTTRTTICDADLSDGLVEIAALLRRTIIDACFEYDLVAPYQCSVTEIRRHVNAPDEELRVLPSCDEGSIPCWRVVPDAVECDYTKTHLKLTIDRGGVVPDPDIRVRASCVTEHDDGPLT